MTDATDSGTSASDELTNNGLPVLTFTGEPGLTIALRGPDGTPLAQGTQYSVSYSGGVYTVTLLDAVPGGAANPFGAFNGASATNNPASTGDGTYTLIASAGGNSQEVGTFVIDTTPPAGPITVVPQTTNDTTPVITGTATVGAGETLTVTVNGVTYTAGDGNLVRTNGSWSLTIPQENVLASGTYAVTAQLTDAAGNVRSDATTAELVIKTALNLGALDMTDGTDSGARSDDELTNDGNPVLTFTGEPGLTIVLKGPDGTPLSQGVQFSVTYGGGLYTVTLLDAVPGGAANPFGAYDGGSPTGNPASTGDGIYTLVAADASGNSQEVGRFSIDTTPPEGPVTVTPQTTADTTPSITGTAVLDADESLYVTVEGKTYEVGDGHLTLVDDVWTLNVPEINALVAGRYSVGATIVDAAGNVLADVTSGELSIGSTGCPFDPFRPDTDRDGLPDAREAVLGLDPTVKDNDVYGDNTLFVGQLYRDLLGREGSQGEVDWWVGYLDSGVLSQFQVIQYFFDSPEFDDKSAAIVRLYHAVLGRSPDYCGFNYWLAAANQGVGPNELAAQFLREAEFVSDGAVGNRALAERLFANLGIDDAAAKAAMVARLDAGELRGDVLYAFIESGAARAATVDDVAIDMLYLGFMDRAGEQAGIDYWHELWDGGTFSSTIELLSVGLQLPEFEGRHVPIEEAGDLTLVGVPAADTGVA